MNATTSPATTASIDQSLSILLGRIDALERKANDLSYSAVSGSAVAATNVTDLSAEIERCQLEVSVYQRAGP